MGMNWQHLQIRKPYKKFRFPVSLKKSKSGSTFLPGKHYQKPGYNQLKRPGCPHPIVWCRHQRGSRRLRVPVVQHLMKRE